MLPNHVVKSKVRKQHEVTANSRAVYGITSRSFAELPFAWAVTMQLVRSLYHWYDRSGRGGKPSRTPRPKRGALP